MSTLLNTSKLADHLITLLRLGAVGREVNPVSDTNNSRHSAHVEWFHQPTDSCNIIWLLGRVPLVEKAGI